MNYRKKNLLTKNDIKDGFLEMLKSLPLDKITVSDLCNKVGINRSTFYYYYDNVRRLFQDVCNDYFDSITERLNICEMIKEYHCEFDCDALIELLRDIRYKDNKLKLFLENGEKELFFVSAFDYLYDVFSISEDDVVKRYKAFSCFSNGLMLVANWIYNGFDIDENTLSLLICSFRIDE